MSDDIMTVMVPMMGVVMMAGILQAIIPGSSTPPEPEPEPEPGPSGYKCPYCDEYFSSMAELITHINAAHPEMPPFIEVDIGWG